jgi:hypothetical protein
MTSVPAAVVAASIRSASASVVASGFSHMIAGTPRSAAAITRSACRSSGVQTASTSSASFASSAAVSW